MNTRLEKNESPTEASPSGASRRRGRFATICLLVCASYGAMLGYNSLNSNDTDSNKRNLASVEDPAATNREQMSGMDRLLESEPDEDALLKKIVKKLQPVPLRFFGDEGEPKLEIGEIKTTNKNDEDKDENKRGEHQKRTMVPHQFLHLHHMKTGGTSVDRLLRCSMDRLKREANYDVPYYSIHECSRTRFATCLTDSENRCRDFMEKASIMSYCAALKYLDEFGWWHDKNEENEVKAITMLRDPVGRVWSMFRFQTKNCYKCKPLKEIYQQLEAGEDTGLDKLCLDQIQNHQVNNLLSTEWPLEVTEFDVETDEKHAGLSDKMIQEAIENMKDFFTVIGITEEIPATVSILGTVFPWMDIDGSKEHGTTSQCKLPHANASPSNNHCGEENTHWDLPDHPDQETHDLIVKHNAMDMKLYEAAVSYFALQKKALGIVDEEKSESNP